MHWKWEEQRERAKKKLGIKQWKSCTICPVEDNFVISSLMFESLPFQGYSCPPHLLLLAWPHTLSALLQVTSECLGNIAYVFGIPHILHSDSFLYRLNRVYPCVASPSTFSISLKTSLMHLAIISSSFIRVPSSSSQLSFNECWLFLFPLCFFYSANILLRVFMVLISAYLWMGRWV